MNRFAIIAAVALSGAPGVQAADMSLVPATAEATVAALQITPYMWGTGLKGRISPFRHGPTLDVDKSFSDVLHDLDFGGFINVWARYDRFVFSGDLMYVETTGTEATGPLPAFQIPGLGVIIPPGASVEGKVDTKQFTATLQGGYRVIDTSQFTLDALAGARFWHVSNDVTVRATVPLVGSWAATHGESFGWVDPLVGVRAFLPLTEKLSVQAQADIGGFGIGADFTWMALATVNYTATEKLSVSAGYKVLDVDYAHGGHVFDTRLSGPVLGMTLRF